MAEEMGTIAMPGWQMLDQEVWQLVEVLTACNMTAISAALSITRLNSGPIYLVCFGSKRSKKEVIFCHSSSLLIVSASFRKAAIVATRTKENETLFRDGSMICNAHK
jgi:hypothetical protein